MHRLAFAALICAGIAASASAAEDRPNTLERSFASGGRIRMELSAGDYRISGSPDEKVHVEWDVRDPDDLRRVRVTPALAGKDGTLEITGPRQHFHVRIRVPERTDLIVRLTAGDLKIDGIQGNKDIESHAGDLEIEMGPVADLRHVEASVWAGDLNARTLKISKGGLFRSLKWDGTGRYEVQAHLKAGDLRLY